MLYLKRIRCEVCGGKKQAKLGAELVYAANKPVADPWRCVEHRK